MLTYNPFADLSAFISPGVMQGYVVLMVILVIIGTVLDIMHKQSAKYFFENARKAQEGAKHQVSGGEKAGLAVKTLTNEVLMSSEFKNTRRRISHLFTMYGLVLFVVTTAVLIFSYPTPDVTAPAAITLLWHLGAAMLCFGGYWFWFAIRVDLVSDAVKWYKFNGRGDLFIVGLIATATFGLLWSFTQQLGVAGLAMVFFVLFVASSTVLFGTVFWSKFAHMFFKPAAAYQKKVAMADGSRENLPDDYDLTDPAVQAKFPDIPEYLGANPPYMGLGISRERPRHY